MYRTKSSIEGPQLNPPSVTTKDTTKVAPSLSVTVQSSEPPCDYEPVTLVPTSTVEACATTLASLQQ